MSLASLIATGTKVWLDGVEPSDVARSRALGVTGATSNPAIVADIIREGRFDDRIAELLDVAPDDDAVAWALNDEIVRDAQQVFLPVWEATRGDDGYVSFELDPLVEDGACPLRHAERVRRYVELARRWSAGHRNRMIKVPATAAGLDALEEIAAAGVTINVTLIFTGRQYRAARDAIWRGAQRRRDGLQDFKSVYSIFISRIDVYTEEHVPALSRAARGQVGIVNAKRIWRENVQFWRDKPLRLRQEIVFASTGVKKATEPPDKYAASLAGSDIETNPAATNEAVERRDEPFVRAVDQMPPDAVLAEIDREVDVEEMERVLMEAAVRKFADPQKGLLGLVAGKRSALGAAAHRR